MKIKTLEERTIAERKFSKKWQIINIALKGLQSDKLSGDGQIFEVWPYFNSLIIIKLPFSQQEHVQIFTLPSPSKTCALPFDFA